MDFSAERAGAPTEDDERHAARISDPVVRMRALRSIPAPPRAARPRARDEPGSSGPGRPRPRRGARRRWTGIFEGILRGGLEVGSRAPLPGTPPWVTLRVEKGGFATGERLAEGPLRGHELDRLRALGLPADERARAALNASYLTEAGVEELRRMLREGTYQIDVPEEGALLAVVWLMDHGQEEVARDVLDVLGLWFPRLRFYPVPHPTSRASTDTFRLQDVGETVRQLDAVVERPMRLRQREGLRRAAVYDRLVALLLEEDRGAGWIERARALLAEPVAPKKNSAFAKLLDQLGKIVRSPQSLVEGDHTFIRSVLDGFVRKRGAPGSEKHRALREKQARELGAPTRKELGTTVADRLRALPPDEGLDSLDGVPDALRRKVSRSLNAPLEELVTRGGDLGPSYPFGLQASVLSGREAAEPVECGLARELCVCPHCELARGAKCATVWRDGPTCARCKPRVSGRKVKVGVLEEGSTMSLGDILPR